MSKFIQLSEKRNYFKRKFFLSEFDKKKKFPLAWN